MNRAFVKEGDDQWLHDVAPTMSALVIYLTKENNGIIVVERKCRFDANGREVHAMSNGLSYAKDEQDTWYVVDED
jgi:hypothetical protein